MAEVPAWLWPMLSAAAAAGGAMAGVRVELRALRERMERVEASVARAHHRIDQMVGLSRR